MFGCSSTSAGDAGAAGAAATMPAICNQTCSDDATGYALDDTMWLLWNENIAGQPSGAQSTQAQCPLGGTAMITGTTTVASNSVNTIHLMVNLSACQNSNAAYRLAFTGMVSWDGTFAAGSPNAVTFKSSALTVSGTINEYDMPAVMETCDVAITDKYDKSANSPKGWLSGELCARTVSD